jgi:hypothetical protein
MSVTVIDIDVRWGDGYANSPSLAFLVAGLPERDEETVYSKHRHPQGTTIYWNECDGFVWWFSWRGTPDDGFGGWRRAVRIDDGTTEIVTGGWHGAPPAAMDAGLPACVDVAVIRVEDPLNRAWPRCGGQAAFITQDRMLAEIASLRPDLEVIPDPYNHLTVKWCGQPSKAEWAALAPDNSRRNHLCVERGDVYSKLGPAA